jgi:CTP:molybdopterin cytidylyltransferase MocA
MQGAAENLWTIVLAAGGSARLGRPKQFVRFRAQPLLARTLANAQDVTPERVIVVIGASRIRARAAIHRHAPRTVIMANTRWREGMSGSLRRGLAALPDEALAALLLTVDQPLVRTRHLRHMIEIWSRRPMRPVAARYDDRLGVPAILPKRVWKAARHSSGDVGAREILRGNADRVTEVALPEAAVDIDTPDDIQRLSS